MPKHNLRQARLRRRWFTRAFYVDGAARLYLEGRVNITIVPPTRGLVTIPALVAPRGETDD